MQVWRVFPYAEDCLSPLLRFACPHPVLHMCALGSTLAVALHDPESATYRVAHYDLQARARRRHPPEDDPLDEITGGLGGVPELPWPGGAEPPGRALGAGGHPGSRPLLSPRPLLLPPAEALRLVQPGRVGEGLEPPQPAAAVRPGPRPCAPVLGGWAGPGSPLVCPRALLLRAPVLPLSRFPSASGSWSPACPLLRTLPPSMLPSELPVAPRLPAPRAGVRSPREALGAAAVSRALRRAAPRSRTGFVRGVGWA